MELERESGRTTRTVKGLEKRRRTKGDEGVLKQDNEKIVQKIDVRKNEKGREKEIKSYQAQNVTELEAGILRSRRRGQRMTMTQISVHREFVSHHSHIFSVFTHTKDIHSLSNLGMTPTMFYLMAKLQKIINLMKYLNEEHDLIEPGLRRYKRQWRASVGRRRVISKQLYAIEIRKRTLLRIDMAQLNRRRKEIIRLVWDGRIGTCDPRLTIHCSAR